MRDAAVCKAIEKAALDRHQKRRKENAEQRNPPSAGGPPQIPISQQGAL
jgi:hypothetical protein